MTKTQTKTRSDTMRAVKSSDTSAELAVARLLRGIGARVRRSASDLPGTPDFTFAESRRAIFVHGCFWHGHTCKRGARVPKANRDYWVNKIAKNKARDRRVLKELRALGWKTLVIWECQLKSEVRVGSRLKRLLKQEEPGASPALPY